MALTTAIFVGESKEWMPELVSKAKQLKVHAGCNDNASLARIRYQFDYGTAHIWAACIGNAEI